jgi:thiamine-monophosphate kinase
MLDVAALGEASPAGPVLRSGARHDDGIWVSGTIGGSAYGLALLQGGFEPWSKTLWTKNLPSSSRLAERSRLDLLAALAHLLPRPRLDLGLALARGRLATAMIDLSDGLSTDLHNLCDASDVGAEIDARRLPLHPALLRAPRRAMKLALSGGEDYELLFTVPRSAERRLVKTAASLGVPVTRIGRITPRRSGVTLFGPHRRRRPLPRTGYEHFRA